MNDVAINKSAEKDEAIIEVMEGQGGELSIRILAELVGARLTTAFRDRVQKLVLMGVICSGWGKSYHNQWERRYWCAEDKPHLMDDAPTDGRR
jgi:hypothetical protein